MLFDAQTAIAMWGFEDFIKSIAEPDEIIEMENDNRRAAVKQKEEEICFESRTKERKEEQKQEEEDYFY
jgi:hypothetical protein